MNDSPIARYLVPIRRWWYVVLGAVLVLVAVALLTAPQDQQVSEEELAAQATQFRATHILIRNNDAPGQLAFDLILLLTEQGDLTNRIVAAMDSGVSTAEVEAVVVEADPNIGTLAITAVQDTGAEAAALASTYAAELVTFLDERTNASVQSDFDRVTAEVDDLEQRIDGLQSDIEGLPEDDLDRVVLQAELDSAVQQFANARSNQEALATQLAGLAESFVTLQEPSPVPATDEEPSVLALPTSPMIRALILGFAGLLLGIVLVLAIDYLDTRIRTRRDAEEAFGLPVIAELPSRSRREREKDPLPTLSDPAGITAEVMRALVLSIELAPSWHLTSLARDADGAVGTKTPVSPDTAPTTMVVTSPLTGDGKSTLVANLALSLAEGGRRVLVVDCDFRRPAVGGFLDSPNGPGMRDMGRVDDRPLRELTTTTAAPNVHLVRAGSKGVTPPWFRGQVAALVERCRREADVVIFDTGPITLTNEASALIPHVDTCLVAARAGKVATDQARGTVELLTQVGARVAGIVLIGSESRRRYGYGYYQAETPDEPRRGRGRRGAQRTNGVPFDSRTSTEQTQPTNTP